MNRIFAKACLALFLGGCAAVAPSAVPKPLDPFIAIMSEVIPRNYLDCGVIDIARPLIFPNSEARAKFEAESRRVQDCAATSFEGRQPFIMTEKTSSPGMCPTITMLVGNAEGRLFSISAFSGRAFCSWPPDTTQAAPVVRFEPCRGSIEQTASGRHLTCSRAN